MKLPRGMLEQLEALLRALKHRVANSIARGVINLVNDATKMQLLQIGALPGEELEGAERFQQYGFSSVPLAGAELVAVFPNGDRGHALVIATDDRRHRPTGEAAGTVTVYNNDGAKIRLIGADIEVVPGAGGEVRIGSATASDPVALKSELDALKSWLDGHIHPDPSSGNTGPPTTSSPTPTGATKAKTE